MDKGIKQTNDVKFVLKTLLSIYQCKMDYSAKQKNGVKLKVKTLQRSYLHMMSQHECPQSLKVIF